MKAHFRGQKAPRGTCQIEAATAHVSRLSTFDTSETPSEAGPDGYGGFQGDICIPIA